MKKNFSILNNRAQNIPNNFNYETYIKITKNKTLSNVYLAYNHYLKFGQHNPTIYKSFWREIYNIPNDFDENMYKLYVKTHYNINIPIKDSKELYSFYSKIGNTIYPINDKYYKIYYNIPNNFDSMIYTIIYPDAYNDDINKIYEFYKNNKEKYPLDELYNDTYNNTYNFKTIENIIDTKYTNDKFSSIYYDSIVMLDNNIKFSYKAFNKRYNFNLDEHKTIALYNNNKNKYPLDDFYYKILYYIPSTLNQKYLNVFKKLYDYNDSYNLNDMYESYYNSQYNMFEDNQYENNLFYFIKNYIDCDLFLYDKIFLYDFSNNKIKINKIYDIYKEYKLTPISKLFIEYYEYLNNYNEFVDTDIIKKKFFLLKPFVEEYFYQPVTNVNLKTNILYTTFYYNNINTENIFANLIQWEEFYRLYTQKDYIINSVIDSFTLKLEPNDTVEYIFILMDNYSHNYISLLQSILKFKYNYKVNIITKKSIVESDKFNYYYNLLNKNYRLNIIDYKEDFSFNDFNNILYDIEFWKKFDANYVIIFNSLAIIKKDPIELINDSDEKCFGFTYKYGQYENIINYNFSIRNIKTILKILSNDSNLNIINSHNFFVTLNLNKPLEILLYDNHFIKNHQINEYIHFIDDETSLINILNN